jgi:hypothetical protein
MATTCVTNRCREYLLKKALDFENDTHNMALYNASSHNQNTTIYTASNEVVGTGYVAKGNTLTGVAVAVDTTNHVAHVDWDDTQWTSSTITATDCMIFADNVTTPAADPSIYIGDFNGSKSTSAGTFTVRMPTAAYNSAVVRLA